MNAQRSESDRRREYRRDAMKTDWPLGELAGDLYAGRGNPLGEQPLGARGFLAGGAMLFFVSQPLPLDQAVEALKRDPTHAVRARVDDLTVEIRAVPEGPTRQLAPGEKSAADVFREIGPWEGETLDELLEFFAEARRRGGSRNVPGL